MTTPASRRPAAIPVLAGASVLLALVGVLSPSRPPIPGRDAGSKMGMTLGDGVDVSRFARATRPRRYLLPRDHGPHFDYQTEWWYYTGNLRSGDRPFGFQLTFFRRGLSPGPPPDHPGLATNQVFFAHFAVTDVSAGEHVFAERWARGAGGLAGADGSPFVVWVEDWRAEAVSETGDVMHLVARDGSLLLDIELRSQKPLARHGDRGISPKSEEPGNASHYVGYTRLSARGRLSTDGLVLPVHGEAWFDHEWSTSALGPRAVGWDWFSLQLDDDTELMYFQIRRDDGTVEAVSGGTVVGAEGSTRRLRAPDVSLAVLDRWRSPSTDAVYPARWRLEAPGEGLDLLVAPRVPDQEMRTSFVYWEGAVRVSGTRGGRAIRGEGYVELTGYARTMQGVF